MAKNVTALYDDPNSAALAVDRLLEAGFAVDDISMLASQQTRGRELAVELETKAPEGALIGGVSGGAFAGIVAALAAVGTISVPLVGLAAAGPYLAALAGVGAGGTVGGLLGGLVGLGIPEHEAKLFADGLEKGRILLGVHAHTDRVDRAEEVFRSTGGHGVRRH